MKVTIGEAVLKNDGKRLENTLTISEDIQRFFTSNLFYAEYPETVETVPRPILNIPALSSIIHFAVAIGAEVEVGEIDSQYFNSCMEIQRYLKTVQGFECLKCTAKLTGTPIKVNYETSKTGLLFSGGSDSTCSWIKRRSENPKLYLIWGLDVLTGWITFWNSIVEKYKHFNLRIIKTNSEEIYASNTLHALGVKLTEGYRPTYSFSVNALGVCAPLTCLDGVHTLQLSSTYPSRHYLDPKYPWAQFRPSFITNQFWRWGNTRCVEVDHEYTTTEKIKYLLKPYLNEGNKVFLRSCGNRVGLLKYGLERMNCNICDKCQRTIGMLAVNNIDPSTVGFQVSDSIWARCRSDIETGRWLYPYLKYHWEEVQNLIPDKIVHDYGGSKAFFQWLKQYKFR